MLPIKRISGFVARCMLYYLILVAGWSGLSQGYRAAFLAGGNLLFCRFGSAGAVSFEPLESAGRSFDTQLVLSIRRPPFARGELDMTSTSMGYRPTAFLVALVLATPIPWSRRLRALAWGLVGITAFVALRLELRLLDAFSDNNALALYAPAPFWKATLKALVLILVKAPMSHYMIPTFVWALVAFRRGDWVQLFGDRHDSKERTTRSTR